MRTWALAVSFALAAVACQEVEVQGGGEGEAPEGGEEGEGEAVDGPIAGEGEGQAEGEGEAVDPGRPGGEGEGEGEPPALPGCDLARWGELLTAHVRDQCTDYAGLMASQESRETLACLIERIGATDPASLGDRHAQLAFWLNTYNAVMVHLAVTKLDDKPDWRPDDAGHEVFSEDRVPVANSSLLLNDIEYQIILGRPAGTDEQKAWHEALFPDPMPADARIHAALNCAAVSCPYLYTAPFPAGQEELDEALAARTRLWLDDPTKGAGPDGISQLFDWFKQDFTAYSGTDSVDKFIEDHRTDGLDGVAIGTIIEYDWQLNACAD